MALGSKPLGRGAGCMAVAYTGIRPVSFRDAELARCSGVSKPGRKSSELVGALLGGNLLDQVDNAAAEFCVINARKGAGQGKAFRGCQKIRNVGRRSRFTEAVRI